MLFTVEKEKIKKLIENICDNDDSVQKYSTPYDLCNKMIQKLQDYKKVRYQNKILVMFNLEVVYTLIFVFKIPAKYIYFVSDSEKRNLVAEKVMKISVFKCVIKQKPLRIILKIKEDDMDMKFGYIIGNPPWNMPKNSKKKRGGGNWALWPKIIEKSLKLLKENGYFCFIHPPAWRNPTHKLWEMLTRDRQMIYLHMCNIKDIKKYFGVGASADYYIIKNTKPKKSFITHIRDENNNYHDLCLVDKKFLPSSNIENFENIIAKGSEERCKVIYSYSFYETRKRWMADEKEVKTETFRYPCLHGIKKEKNGGKVIWYSSRNDKGHFGESKVILNDRGILRPVNDFDGKYGMTQHCFAIKTTSNKESEQIVKALESDKFQSITKSCRWTGCEIDFEMFKYFKKDFWKEFV